MNCETNDCRKEKRGCKGCYYEDNNIDKSIEIVRKFNKENRYRDGGVINNAIENVLSELEELQKDLTLHEETSFEFQEENIKLKKELETLKTIKEAVKYLETQGCKEETYFVVGKDSFLASTFGNAFENYIHEDKIQELLDKYEHVEANEDAALSLYADVKKLLEREEK